MADDVTSSEKAPLEPILCNFWLRMHTLKGTPASVTGWWRHFWSKGPTRADIAQLGSCACIHPREPPSGSRDFRLLRVTFDDVTSGQKAPLGQVLPKFRLRMHTRSLPVRAASEHVTSGDVISGDVTSGRSTAWIHHKWCFGHAHILLMLVSDLQQVGGFLWVLWFPLSIKLTTTI
jgi:hypothetical protein